MTDLPPAPYRVLREHGCPCGFRNEITEGLVRPGAAEPAIDVDELEVCPGCRGLVPVSRILHLPLRAVLGFEALSNP